MMGKIRKKTKTNAQISTASLPDIVFLLLFFFMVSTVIRTEDEIQSIKTPRATQLTKAEMKLLIKELKIGKPSDVTFGSEPLISSGGKFLQLDQITQWVEEQKSELPESMRDQIIILIRADEEVKMGLVADIQERLRESNARKILYRANNENITSL